MKEILINSNSKEVRIAIIENGDVIELFLERYSKRSVVGNIYKGKVAKVLPGMQSAFIDIGTSKAAFLHVTDLHKKVDKDIDFLEEDLLPPNILDDTGIEESDIYLAPIEEMLSEKDEIIVQVTKDAIATKGARLTTHISIPGRCLVLMPDYDHIGVSRKIEEEEDRERLRQILLEIKPESFGLIARTISENLSKDRLVADLDFLTRIWSDIKSKIDDAKTPSKIYGDHDLIFKVLRDIATPEISRILIDNKSDHEKMKQFLETYMPMCIIDIVYYDDKEISLFDFYNVEIEINKLLDKKVWLRSGGYVIIDYTEALTVIDVNTGKYVGKHDFNDTILKTNLEAAKEIALQLKLRNIGGIIIVDFIDMERLEDRDKVITFLEQNLKSDRAKTSVANITSLGLVEITRKRVQESISKMMSEPCPTCEGRGAIKSKITVSYDILRALTRASKTREPGTTITVECHSGVADLMLIEAREELDYFENDKGIHIVIKPNVQMTYEQYKLIIR